MHFEEKRLKMSIIFLQHCGATTHLIQDFCGVICAQWHELSFCCYSDLFLKKPQGSLFLHHCGASVRALSFVVQPEDTYVSFNLTIFCGLHLKCMQNQKGSCFRSMFLHQSQNIGFMIFVVQSVDKDVNFNCANLIWILKPCKSMIHALHPCFWTIEAPQSTG